ncbi:hypothetical protein BH20VER2_BH20VER2_14590 [soil metagenome]|nr:vanadium-dependent haloperoxidase [Chthoniobacterales bacterium]
MKLPLSLALLGASAFSAAQAQLTDFRTFYGERFSPAPSAIRAPLKNSAPDVLHRWNQIATDASGLDHTPVAPGEKRVFGEQLGPGRASRAMAIVHIAMFDALNFATGGGYPSWTGHDGPPAGPISADATVAQAAHNTLVALFPSQAPQFALRLEEQLQLIAGTPEEIATGRWVGARIARTLLQERVQDGGEVAEPMLGIGHHTSSLAGHWRQDPISLIPVALGAYWGDCRPFVIPSGAKFRLPPPPAMTSSEYTAAYDEVKALGGDGTFTPTIRTPEQTFIGIFWAYDGTPSLCAPPRLYNQITVQLADQRGVAGLQLARLLALVNIAMADTGIAAWDSKYHYDVWRPITGIRESDEGTGPTGSGDGNPATVGDVTFMPLGAPASNLTGPNFTPPFPAYPSGHAAFGGALFQTLRRFFGTDEVAFTFVSDEFNGVTLGNNGIVRPYLPRTFTTLSQAEEENARSRIYLGIHWSFDATQGVAQGRDVADYVFDRAFAAKKVDRAARK